MEKQQILSTLKKYFEDDQEVRNRLFSKDHAPTPKELKKMAEMDKKHLDFMKNLVSEHGLITISEFGKDASDHAWLLVQHSPRENVEFMKEYLALMESNLGDVDIKNHAYLKDRTLMYEAKPQIYGTQMQRDKKTGKVELYTVANRQNLNRLREDVGLEPIEEYLKLFD